MAKIIAAGLIGALIAGGAMFMIADDLMMLEDESRYGFEETVEEFYLAVEEGGWGVLNETDMQEVKAGHGFEVNPVKVFDLCSAEYSAEILELDDERIVSPMMPCRIAIYEKSNGNTYIARMNSSLVARAFGGQINETMQVASAETEEIISDLIVD